jgi:adenosylhomocysteinase
MGAKGRGCNVIITEMDEVRALEAVMDGFRVMPMDEAAKLGDIFVSATGNKHVIRGEHIKVMKNGAMLANSGHFDNEIEKEFLEKHPKRNIRRDVDEFSIGTRKVYLLADGRLVNLVAGQGHPAEIMDMSFANQALGAEYLVKNAGKLDAAVIKIPEEIDREIARLKLESMDICMDELTPEQKKYMGEWREGT